jgi:antitoxin component of MazEF toxin-antitoxin module
MRVKIAKWGKNAGIRIPKPLLEVIGLPDDGIVELVAENEKLIIKSARERLTLEKLFNDWEGDLPDSYDWGGLETPQGQELL